MQTMKNKLKEIKGQRNECRKNNNNDTQSPQIGFTKLHKCLPTGKENNREVVAETDEGKFGNWRPEEERKS